MSSGVFSLSFSSFIPLSSLVFRYQRRVRRMEVKKDTTEE